MIKEKLASTAKFVKENPYLMAFGAIAIGSVAIEMKYPGTFEVKEEIPTMKIIHVHVTE